MARSEREPFLSRRQRSQEPQPVRRHAVVPDSSQLFRRSRTLTGTTSGNVTAASDKRGQLLSQRLRTHSLRKHRMFLTLATLSSWAAVGVSVVLLNQYIGSLHIGTSGLVANRSLEERIETSVNEYFSTRPLDRFRFSVNEAEATTFVQQHVPELASLSFEDRKGLASSRVEASIREPVARWQLGSVTYYVDRDGVAFEENHYPDPAVSVDDNSGLPPTEQRRLASRAFLSFIGQAVSSLTQNENASYAVKRVAIPPNTLKQVELILEKDDIRIKLDTDRDPWPQIMDTVAALKFIEKENIRVSYVDVRIAGKAYYR